MMRFPLADALQDHRNEDIVEESGIGGIADVVHRMMNLGVVYDSLEDLWAECLWNDWYADRGPDCDRILPSDWDQWTARAMGVYRRTMTWEQVFASLLQRWRSLVSEGRLSLTNKPRVAGAVLFRDHFLPVWTGYASPVAEDSVIGALRALAVKDVFVDGLLDEPLPAFASLSVSQLLAGLNSLTSLAGAVWGNLFDFAEDAAVDVEHLVAYSPVFDCSELGALLETTVGFTQEQALRFLEQLTFSGSVREDIWLKPMIPLSANRVILVLPVLLFPNPMHYVDHWLRVGGIEIEGKGREFETYVRESITTSNRLRSAEVCDTSLTLTVGARSEEIDLLAHIGDAILIAELKCSLYPSSPRDYHNYIETLRGAAEQARRRAGFVQDHLVEVTKQTGWYSLNLDVARVVPVVVSNHMVGSGLQFNGVPVVDHHILEQYFRSSELRHFVTVGEDDKSIGGFANSLYTTETEAASNLPAYLASPPQISIPGRAMKVEPSTTELDFLTKPLLAYIARIDEFGWNDWIW